jgi:hypothetical protein
VDGGERAHRVRNVHVVESVGAQSDARRLERSLLGVERAGELELRVRHVLDREVRLARQLPEPGLRLLGANVVDRAGKLIDATGRVASALAEVHGRADDDAHTGRCRRPSGELARRLPEVGAELAHRRLTACEPRKEVAAHRPGGARALDVLTLGDRERRDALTCRGDARRLVRRERVRGHSTDLLRLRASEDRCVLRLVRHVARALSDRQTRRLRGDDVERLLERRAPRKLSGRRLLFGEVLRERHAASPLGVGERLGRNILRLAQADELLFHLEQSRHVGLAASSALGGTRSASYGRCSRGTDLSLQDGEL